MDLQKEILKFLAENNTGRFIDIAPHLRTICPDDDKAIFNVMSHLLYTPGLQRDSLIIADKSYDDWRLIGHPSKGITVHNTKIPAQITLKGLAYYNQNYKDSVITKPAEEKLIRNRLDWLKCPITGQLILDSTITDASIEYNIVFNSKPYSFKLEKTTNWFDNKSISDEQRLVLSGMLYNNEWPIEKETLITQNLVNNIMRFGDYPKNFEEKLDFFALNLFLNKGGEYKTFTFKLNDFFSAYSNNEEEFARILKGLSSKGLIEASNIPDSPSEDTEYAISLTENGLRYAQSVDSKRRSLDPKRFKSQESPKLLLITFKEDEYYRKKLEEYIGSFGCTYSSIIAADDISSESTISNARDEMHGNSIDYVIFIKSKASDSSNTYGSMLDIAMEAHDFKYKKEGDYLFVAFVDDSPVTARPRLGNYDSTMSDFRITTMRKRIIKKIRADWSNRQAAKDTTQTNGNYHLQSFDLTKDERFWLETVYQKFIKNEDFVSYQLLFKLRDKVSVDFQPNQISPLLLSGDKVITLLGIWQIHPESNIFEKFDKVVYAIKDILSSEANNQKITSEQVIECLQDITVVEVYQIFFLMGYYDLQNSFGHSNDFHSCWIGVNNGKTYGKYRSYTGLQDLMDDYLKDVNIEEFKKNKQEPNVLNADVDIENPHSFKTSFAIKDKNNIKPVIGVTELAKDLAEIIRSLPSEKGQMIGIFGKWGRGKTFLLKELWKILEVEKSTQYINIEYHAWKYQETPASWAYLYELFAEKFLNKPKEYLAIKEWYRFYLRLLCLNRARLGLWPLVTFFVALALGVVTVVESKLKADQYTVIIIPSVLIGFIFYVKKLSDQFSTKAIALIKKYTYKHSFKETLGIQADIQHELITLLKVWVPDKKVGALKTLLVVEDIDRCRDEKVLEIVDALRIMLDDEEISKRVVIVAAIDERILKNNIAIKYKSLLIKESPPTIEEKEIELNNGTEKIDVHELISEYLDKAFILAIRLGELNSEQRIEFLKELLKEEIDENTLVEADKLIEYEENKRGFEKNQWPVEVLNEIFNDKEEKAAFEDLGRERELIKQTGKPYRPAIRNDDFVKINGDIALEDEKGNLTSPPVLFNQIQNRLEAQNKFEKLTAKEVKLMMVLIQSWEKATPRRIRIFYYRYLLCKNMLINKYSSLERVTVWQDEKGMPNLFALLLRFTILNNPAKISEEKAAFSKSSHETITIPEIESGIPIYREDYLHLLEILELVIAY